MISAIQTNFLYLADTLPIRYPGFYQSLASILQQCSIQHDLIQGTKDIWARDYMPLQVATHSYVQFVYNPAYLRNSKKWRATISDVDAICENLRVKPVKSILLIDGGNIVATTNRAIVTERVFAENPELSHSEIEGELKALLQIDRVIFIPADPNDFTGHADGMVRFYNEDTVLVNDYSKESKLKKALEHSLAEAGLQWTTIPNSPYGNLTDMDATGCYINYLEIADVILLPAFNISLDETVHLQFQRLFPERRIFTIDCTAIAREGGLLNCISWNVLKF